MNQYDHLSDEELERIASGNNNYTNYSDEQLKSIAGEEPTIGQDIKRSILNTPEYALNMAKALPSELSGAYHMPLGRSLKNIGQGIENLATLPLDLGSTLVDYLAKKHVPYAEKLSKIYPRIPEHDLFGLGEQQPGDVLFQSAIPFGGLGKLTKGIKGIKGVATRAGGASAYSTAQGDNPIESLLTGTALEGLVHGATNAPTTALNIGERFKTGVSNLALNRAEKGIESGRTLTPEQAMQNYNEQYTTLEGKPMQTDFGTLVGNKMLQDVYNVGSKIPLTGGRDLLANLDRQLFDKKEALGKLQHEKEQGELSKENQGYEQQLQSSIKEIQKSRDILENQLPPLENKINEAENIQQQQKQAIEAAPIHLENLRQKDIDHNLLLKNNITENFESGKANANEAYKPFNELEADLNSIRMPEHFESKYKKAYEEVKAESEDLKEAFHDDQDLGNKVSKEIKKGNAFFEEGKPKTTGTGKELSTVGSIFKFKKATPQAISTHIKNLQSLAQEAFAAGKHRESALLNKMANGLKDDMKKILEAGGYHEAVNALETGDKIFKEEVLPYYKNKEIKKLVTDIGHHLSDTSRVTLSNTLHQPNMQAILSKMSPEAKNAALYELITRGKYGKQGHDLTPKEIASAFRTHLKSNVRDVISQSNPQMANYLENLNPMLNKNEQLESEINTMKKQHEQLSKEANRNITKHEAQSEKAETGKKTIEQKLKESDERFANLMKERFGVPKVKSKSIFAAIKQFSPLNAAGLGTAIYALGHVTVPHILEVVGASVLPFKLTNRILTEIENSKPKLLTHFVEGRKVKPNLKKTGKLEEKIKESVNLVKPISNEKKKKRLELLLTKGLNSK